MCMYVYDKRNRSGATQKTECAREEPGSLQSVLDLVKDGQRAGDLSSWTSLILSPEGNQQHS